jgi:hypothetical protein
MRREAGAVKRLLVLSAFHLLRKRLNVVCDVILPPASPKILNTLLVGGDLHALEKLRAGAPRKPEKGCLEPFHRQFPASVKTET